MGTMVLLDLLGGVALLLWGLHMVQSGFLRAFGADLRRFLAKGLNNRFNAFGAGLVLTALLQSSTATGLVIASYPGISGVFTLSGGTLNVARANPGLAEVVGSSGAGT